MAIFRGTRFIDEILGTDEADIAFGRLDDDALYLGLGADRGFGGKGNDLIDGNDGDDYLQGNKGDDLLFGGRGNDVIKGDKDNDTIFGGEGIDRLEGSTGNDYVNGHGLLLGGRGNDYLYSDQVGSLPTQQVGGPGANAFVNTAYGDYSTSVVEVLDFGKGDKFGLACDFAPVGGPALNTAEVFEALDTNADHALDGTDPLGWLGSVTRVGADLLVWVSDDLTVFRGVQALTDGQLA